MPNHIEWPGTLTDYASTPDSAALSVTGDHWLEVKVDHADWNVGTHIWSAKGAGAGTRSYLVYITGGLIIYGRCENGTDWLWTGGTWANVDTIPIPDGDIAWIRITADMDAGTGGKALVKTFYSLNGTDYYQLGGDHAAVGSAPGTVYDSAQEHWDGRDHLDWGMTGGMYFSKIWSDLGSTLEYFADYETLTQAELDAKSFVEESANAATVTINGTAWSYSGTPAGGGGRGPINQLLLGVG